MYKRQVITTAGGPPQLVHEDDSIRDSTLEDVIKFYKLIESSDVIDVTRIVSSDTADPVSYTHLDVYKRQGLFCGCWLFGLKPDFQH